MGAGVPDNGRNTWIWQQVTGEGFCSRRPGTDLQSCHWRSVVRLLRVHVDVCCRCRWAQCPRERREPAQGPLPCTELFARVSASPPAPAAGDSRREPPRPSRVPRVQSLLCSARDMELWEGPSRGCAEQEPRAAAPAPSLERPRGTSRELRAAAEAPGTCASGGAGPVLSWSCMW